MVLSSRDRVKSSKQKSSKRKKLKDKRIHDNLILLRVTFSIIVFESLRRIARWVAIAVISSFCKLANTTPTILETPPHQVVPVSTTRLSLSRGLWQFALHPACIRRDSISFYAMSFYSASCYVFAYGWGRGQSVVLSDLPIGSKCSRTFILNTHTVRGVLSNWPPLADRLL